MAQDYEELAAEIEADTMEVRVPICYRRNNSNLMRPIVEQLALDNLRAVA
jgi:hypothetical protein